MGVSLKSYKFETLLEREDGWVPKNPLYDVQFQILDHSGKMGIAHILVSAASKA